MAGMKGAHNFSPLKRTGFGYTELRQKEGPLHSCQQNSWETISYLPTRPVECSGNFAYGLNEMTLLLGC